MTGSSADGAVLAAVAGGEPVVLDGFGLRIVEQILLAPEPGATEAV